jgi:hypothetical protein
MKVTFQIDNYFASAMKGERKDDRVLRTIAVNDVELWISSFQQGQMND